MLERRRCHPLYMVERFFRLLVPIAVYILCLYFSTITDGKIMNANIPAVKLIIIISVAAIAVVLFFIWLGWRNRWVSASENTLIYESGVFVKKRTTIPFSKINTIDMGRNIFQRIFGTCRLKIDTGAIGADSQKQAEMDLVFALSEAETFRSYILKRSWEDDKLLKSEGKTAATAEQSEPKWAVRARFMDFFLYGLTSSSVWRLFCLLLIAASLISELSTGFIEKVGAFLFPYIELAWESLLTRGIIMVVLITLLFVLTIAVIANILTIILAAIKFYGFRTAREGNNIVVRYGIITVKNYTVQADNVHAVIIRQNLLQQMLKKCSVDMVSIGYGNEKAETALLFPIISVSKLPWLIETLLPEYSIANKIEKAPDKATRFHILRPILWSSLFLSAGVLCCELIMDSLVIAIIAAVVLFVSIVINAVLDFVNTAVGCDDKVMLVRSGGFRKCTHLIRLEAVQSVKGTSGIFQRKHGLASCRVDFHSTSMGAIATARHMDADIPEKLSDALIKH